MRLTTIAAIRRLSFCSHHGSVVRCLSRLDRWAAGDHDDRVPARLSVSCLHHHNTDDLLSKAAVTPSMETVLRSGDRRKVLGQVSPQAPGAHSMNSTFKMTRTSAGSRPSPQGSLAGAATAQVPRLTTRQLSMPDHRVLLSVDLVPRHRKSPGLVQSQRIAWLEPSRQISGQALVSDRYGASRQPGRPPIQYTRRKNMVVTVALSNTTNTRSPGAGSSRAKRAP